MHDQILEYAHPMLLKLIVPDDNDRPGFQAIFRFRNGYGASVVQHRGSYGGDRGKYELAVARWNSEKDNEWSICYDTPVTDDVLGHLDPIHVHDILNQLAALAPDAQALPGAVLD